MSFSAYLICIWCGEMFILFIERNGKVQLTGINKRNTYILINFLKQRTISLNALITPVHVLLFFNERKILLNLLHVVFVIV